MTGNRPVAEDTRERVRDAIAHLGFRPNEVARSLRSQRSRTAALLIPDLTNPFYPTLARGLQDVLAVAGYHTFVCNTDARADLELELVQDVVGRRVDGIVMLAFASRGELAPVALDAGVPLVSLGDRIDDARVDMVASDDEGGAYVATRRLIELGHERLAFVGGDAGPNHSRRRGFERALAQAGLDVGAVPVVEGEWSRAGGVQAFEQILSAGPAPTAIFCANDLIAIGVMDAARTHGLRLPADLSLVGFDDIEAAALVTPALTTVVNPAYELGRAAGRLLLDRVTGRYAGPRRVETLPCPLVERASTTARS